MGVFDRASLSDAETAAARDLFDRIVAAESDKLTDEQRSNPRGYLLATWHAAAEAVMRPIQQRAELEAQLDQFRDAEIDAGDLPEYLRP